MEVIGLGRRLTEGEPYFKPLGGKPLSDTTHTVPLDNGHVLRNWDLAFKKTQPLAPCKLSSVPNSIVNCYDLAVKRKRTSPSKRRDTNETGPSTSYVPAGAKTTKWRRTIIRSFKGSKFAYPDLDCSLDLDHWDKVLEKYLGTDSDIVNNSQNFGIYRALDQS